MTQPPELGRVQRALRTIDGQVADRVEPSEVGSALLVDELPLVWRRVNLLRVDDGAADPALVAREADRLLAGLAHRAVFTCGPEVARALCRDGWTLDREVVLVNPHQRPPAASNAEEVSLADLCEHRTAFRASRPYGNDPRLIAQLAEIDRRYTETGARHFAVRDAGRWVASCQLLSAQGVGEVHAVGTLEEHRGRGHARSVIEKALLASAEAGNALTFIQAIEADWPKHFYRRLGFEDVGVFDYLYRFEPDHPAAAFYA